ncbi:carbohydrate ABC transporter permease [Ruthenibacterium lactatiformans]|uniref:carbohydrate ABC transporter permease n=1 Tax=Ruthenibacterium lactatiformans TaxID=1550024 RepID=UPI0026DBBA01|nr:sugar ABC transporter permease [Ruthenibacterium lactatiformans]
MKNFKFYRFADLKRKTQQRIIIVSFLLFPVMLLIVFSYLPLTQLLLYSFTDWNGTSRNFQFVGFENYAKLWQDPEQFAVLKVSLYYIIGTLIQTALALYFSTILSFKVRFKNFFKAVIFFPYLINGVAIGFIFLLFYRGGGMLDVVMQLCGLGTHIHKWLGEPRVVNWSIVATSIWRYMGFMFVIFYGAIASIPSDIYEAAAIDGANAWQRFWFIIVPSIRQVIFVNLVINISGALSIYEMPYIMTGGANGTKTFLMNILDTAFKYNKYGVASSMSLVLLAVVLLVAALQKAVIGKEEKMQ